MNETIDLIKQPQSPGAAPHSDNLFELKDLVVKRGGRVTLEVKQLKIHRGEILAIIGPNGSGKSTLLLVLNRLFQPDSGSILFREEPIAAQDELAYRRRVALVLQDPLLFDASVFDNVAMGLRFRGLPRQEIRSRVEHWLDRLGVSHLRNQRARRLSGGEAQRINLARALVLQPEVLLLDEPFSALDSPTRLQLLEDLHALISDLSLSTIFITHDLDEALYLGDRVAVLLGGSLRQCGSPQEVFTAPADREVAAFVGVETVLAGSVVAAREGLLGIDVSGHMMEAVGDLPVGRSVLVCLRPEDVTLLPAVPQSSSISSARNRFNGRVVRTTPQGGALMRVVVDCGFSLTALVTRLSAQEMGLEPGKPVMTSFKASAIHLISR